MSLICVEGGVGAGKSTICSLLDPILQEHFGKQKVCIIDEPVDEWIDNGILKLSYEQPKLYSFPAQCVFFTSRIRHIQEQVQSNVNATVFLTERSPFSDQMFWNLKLELEDISPVLHKAYLDMWKEWQNLLPLQPSLFIYFKVSLDTCMKRVKERNREAEKTMNKDYQKRLLEEHDKMFLDKEYVLLPDQKTNVPCITIDLESSDYLTDKNALRKIAKQIIEKINEST